MCFSSDLSLNGLQLLLHSLLCLLFLLELFSQGVLLVLELAQTCAVGQLLASLFLEQFLLETRACQLELADRLIAGALQRVLKS